MSKFTREEQIQIVQWAMNLTATIESEQAQIYTIENSCFRAKPLPPSKQTAQTIQPNYPTPQKSNYAFKDHIKNDTSLIGKIFSKKGIIAVIVTLIGGNILGAILEALGRKFSIFFYLGFLLHIICALIIPACVVTAIIKYVEYSQKRKEYNKELANNPEYLEARTKAERTAQEQQDENQKKLDEQYKNAMVKYDATVEVYNKELAEFEAKKKIELNILNQDLSSNINALTELYDTTLLIPKNNRALNQLVWFYNDMSTSEHDFERSLDVLNAQNMQDALKSVNEKVDTLTNVTYQGFSEVLSGIDYSNYQLDEINNNLGKVRRDINIGNAAAITQRRKMNKNIKSTNAKLDELLK